MGMSTATFSLFNNLNRTETLATKSYLRRKNYNNKRSTQSFKTGFRKQETNLTVKIQAEQVKNTFAKFQLNQRRSHRRIYQTLETVLPKNYDDQLY
ncbi:hypothetical protein N665_0207s0004 [Sinapis alba]|nr:hypothetical protein N665_0207s0004 [Sinapis alba]